MWDRLKGRVTDVTFEQHRSKAGSRSYGLDGGLQVATVLPPHVARIPALWHGLRSQALAQLGRAHVAVVSVILASRLQRRTREMCEWT